MPPVSSSVRFFLWILVGILTITLGIFTAMLETSLGHSLRRLLKWNVGKPPTRKPKIIWIAFYLSAALFIIVTAYASSSPEINTKVTPPGDWTKIIRPTIHWGVANCSSRIGVLPESIHPQTDPESTWYFIYNSAYDYDGLFPDVYGQKESDFVIEVLLSNIVEGQEWVELKNFVNVKIQSESVSVFHGALVPPGCGGGGKIRIFGQIPLAFNQYPIEYRTEISEFDFLSLQPGEFEHLIIPVECKSPGSYKLDISFTYIYMGQQDKFTLESPIRFVCPSSFSLWDTLGSPETPELRYLGKYEWIDGDYVYITEPSPKQSLPDH
jgi:hypothetical protein